MGAAWLDAGPAGDALRRLKASALDRGAPVPLCAQQHRLTGRSSLSRSFLVERGVAYGGAAIGCGGATSGEKQSATKAMGRYNAEICLQRDLDQRLVDWCERQERQLRKHRDLFGADRPAAVLPGFPGYRGFGQRLIAEPKRLSLAGHALKCELRNEGRASPRIIAARDDATPKPLEIPDVVELASRKVRDREVNTVPGPRIRTITTRTPGPLFGMRKADMAAAARVIGYAVRPDLYWPPPRSIPNASPRHEIFVMKAAESVQNYAEAA